MCYPELESRVPSNENRMKRLTDLAFQKHADFPVSTCSLLSSSESGKLEDQCSKQCLLCLPFGGHTTASFGSIYGVWHPKFNVDRICKDVNSGSFYLKPGNGASQLCLLVRSIFKVATWMPMQGREKKEGVEEEMTGANLDKSVIHSQSIGEKTLPAAYISTLLTHPLRFWNIHLK